MKRQDKILICFLSRCEISVKFDLVLSKGGFLGLFRFPPPIKLTATIQLKNIAESGLRHHNPNPNPFVKGMKTEVDV